MGGFDLFSQIYNCYIIFVNIMYSFVKLYKQTTRGEISPLFLVLRK